MLKAVSLGKSPLNHVMSVLMAEPCNLQKMVITAGTLKEAVLSALFPVVPTRPPITPFTLTPPKLAPHTPVAVMITPSTWEKCKPIS